jgi:NAD(P)-dependent dehydrogenase (short-subunit alcohol dehydrogenase family)
MEHWGGLQVLVNNAGVATAGGVEETPIEDWEWVLDIDLMGVVRGCREFAGLFRRQGQGHFVNMASFAALAGLPHISSYGVAKAGVVSLSESLRAEMAPHGVGVSVVCPAFVNTDLTESMRVTREGTRRQVKAWMESSGVSADDVATSVYQAVSSGRFLVLTHQRTRWAWRYKRWLPERYFRSIVNHLEKR